MGKKDSTRDSSSLRPAGGGAALKFLESHRLLRAALIGLCAFMAAMALLWSGMLDDAELASYDARVRSGAPGGRSELITVVDFDEATVQSANMGQWGTWSREVYADLVTAISRAGPRLIVFDMLFIDDNQSAGDQDFAEACKQAGNVVLACNFAPGERAGTPTAKDAERFSLGARHPDCEVREAASLPYRKLRDAVAAVGSVHFETDPDNVGGRAVSPAVNCDEHLWPTLSTAAVRAYSGDKPTLEGGSLVVGDKRFPLDSRGRRLNYWYGPGTGEQGRYRRVPAGWVLANRDGELERFKTLFKDKIVMVGASAAGAFEQRTTPMGIEPGMYIHAVAIENLVRGDSVHLAGGAWTAVLVLALAMLVALAFPGRGWQAALRGTGAYVLLAGGYLAGAYLVYSRLHLWVALIAPQIGAGLSFGGSLLAGYLVEGRQVRRFRRAFSRFLSPEVLAEVSKNLDDLRPGMGRRREITMMFCDMRGFTPMSEKLEPEQVVELLDVYLEAMSDAIMATGGTLSKYLGDGIMAFWGAPQAVPDHAERTARAALAMVAAQEVLKVRLADEGKPVFDIGIGLHTGPAVVGTVGSERRMEYTAIGDTVNLASRVEQLTKQFEVRIVVTADFAKGLRDKFEFKELGSVRVKGRSAEVKVLELKAVKKSLEGSQ